MATQNKSSELPLPPHFNRAQVSAVWRVPYETRAREARQWASEHGIPPASADLVKLLLILIDVQNTFCIPDFELFVAGRSGMGAVEDNQRLCEFIYRNLGRISHITATLDTHQALQIFHANFLVGPDGRHPAPYTTVSAEDVRQGRWSFDPAIAQSLGVTVAYGNRLLAHYTSRLEATEKYALSIWPYHAMLGGIGHALVPAIEEALFYHGMTRSTQPSFIIKGREPFTEHYSALGPEVLNGPDGERLGVKNQDFLSTLRKFDGVIIAGQAKSHCVAWTIADLLADLQAVDPALARKIYLLDDCSSPVVVPGADFTAQAEAAYQRFEAAGMHRVRSSDPIARWPGNL